MPAGAQQSDSDAVNFLDAVFGSAPESKWASLWTRQAKDSIWCALADGIPAIADKALRLSVGSDVYIGVSVADRQGSAKTRINAASAAGIAGLWADFDFSDGTKDAHKSKKYPPDEKAVMEFLDDLGVPPTVIVHSGNGLHVWWLFNEFWTFEDEHERQSAAELSRNWYKTIAFKAAVKGYAFDAVWDLSRVLRIPGTWNYKGEEKLPVRLLSLTERRYQPDDFERYLIDDATIAESGVTSAIEYTVDPLLIARADASAPISAFDAMYENDENFRNAWNHKGRGGGDGSMSSYDQTLANLAVNYRLTDQEVADLIIQHRRKYNDPDGKAQRLDYLRRTIRAAHDRDDKLQAAERVPEAKIEYEHAKVDRDDEAQREARRVVLDAVGAQLGLHVVNLVRYGSEPPTYRLYSLTHSVDLGGVDGLTKQEKFRDNVFGGMNHWIGRHKQKEWDELIQALISIREDQDVGAEATAAGRARMWLESFLEMYPAAFTAADGFASRHPFSYPDGGIAFSLDDLRDYLRIEHQEKITAPKLGPMLTQLGCRPSKVNILSDTGKRIQRHIWVIPEETVTAFTAVEVDSDAASVV